MFIIIFLVTTYLTYLLLKPIIDKKDAKRNPNIEAHKKKLEEDAKYQEYLKWAKENNQTPNDKPVEDNISKKRKEYAKEFKERFGIDIEL